MGLGYQLKMPVKVQIKNLTDKKVDCNHCAKSGLNNFNGRPCKDKDCSKDYSNFKPLEVK